jgi:hypothetical protein
MPSSDMLSVFMTPVEEEKKQVEKSDEKEKQVEKSDEKEKQVEKVMKKKNRWKK